MSQFPGEDPKLSAFLHKYRPIPPEAAVELEVKLMSSLPPRSRRNYYPYVWAIAASLLLTWTGYRYFQPAWKYGAVSQELEAFLIDNWEETLEIEVTTTEW